MKFLANIILCIFFLCLNTDLLAQGCSDAGFCTINTFKPTGSDSLPESKNLVKLGISNGAADHNISVFSAWIEYNRRFNNNFNADIKLTSLSQNGNDINTFGLSDVFLNLNYLHTEKIRFSAGLKIPLTDGNAKKDGIPLPMDYQTSLGTFDIIGGFGYKIQKLDIVAAIQQPITQNENQFLSEHFPAESIFSSFHSTNNYKRRGDVLLRISYPFNINNNFIITPGILPIYHLSNDKFTDSNGKEREITGSQGLTLNLNLYLDYYLNLNNKIQLSIGAPVVVRDARPEGLTRSYVVSLEYRIGF